MAEALQVYSYNRCSTCRKALAWLTERGIDHEVHDITLTPPSKEMLVAAHQSLGDRKLLFNTSGQSYRAMGAAAVKALSDDEALEALDRLWEELAHTLEQGPVLNRSQDLLVALLEEIKRSSFRQIRDQGDVDALISELDGLNFNPGVPTPKDQA